ncbi:MAG: repair protein [Segetibacter sp.]|nr:repair protein [Segetibacter sp.]
MESIMDVSALYEVAEVELIYKSKVKASNRHQITSAKEAYQVLLKAWDENKIEFVEQFKVLFLNKANAVLAIYDVSTGGISGTVADPRVIFAAALKANCCGITISHNHLSGNLKPSRQDEELTEKIKVKHSTLNHFFLNLYPPFLFGLLNASVKKYFPTKQYLYPFPSNS